MQLLADLNAGSGQMPQAQKVNVPDQQCGRYNVPWHPYWLWMRERDDSPWYPTARLFRQEQPGDWAGLMNRVAESLENSGLGDLHDPS